MRADPRRPRVLVADADPGARAALALALRDYYEVHFAGDAVHAVRKARLLEPDVVLLEYELPAGYAPIVVERLRSLPELAHVVVILVSGWDDDWSWDDLLAMDAAAFVPKPVERDELVDEIEHALAA